MKRISALPRHWPPIALVALIFVAFTATGQETPIGSQFQVNTYTTFRQGSPAVAMNAEGTFVAVWESRRSPQGDVDSIQARLFAADGAPLGDQFIVDAFTLGEQTDPSTAMTPDEDFVVVWRTNGAFVQFQLFASDGSRLGPETTASQSAGGFVFRTSSPAVAMAPDSSFVVAWQSTGSFGNDNYFSSIQARRFDVNGVPLGDQFQVNTYTTSFQRLRGHRSVAVADSGDFVIVWQSDRAAGPDLSNSIQARRFDAAGVPFGDEFQVNDYTTRSQDIASVAMAPDGNFVVAWRSFGGPGTDFGLSIQARRFLPDGTPLANQFQVNTYRTSNQVNPSVAMEDDGDFVVAWTSYEADSSDIDDKSLHSQLYASNGTPRGEQFQVNTYTTSYQDRPSVAASGDRFAVVWRSMGSVGDDDSGTSMQGQLFTQANVFSDGFESGDMSAWSMTSN